jgi:hypothetical protein
MSLSRFDPLESLPPARKRIAALLLGQGLDRFDVEMMLADFADELAQEIRDERNRIIAERVATPDYIRGLSYAASLIDSQGHLEEGPHT